MSSISEGGGLTIQPGSTFNMTAEYKLLQVVKGRGLIRGGRGDFEVHPGDQVVVPSSPDYVIINNGSETLHLEPVNDKMNSKK